MCNRQGKGRVGLHSTRPCSLQEKDQSGLETYETASVID